MFLSSNIKDLNNNQQLFSSLRIPLNIYKYKFPVEDSLFIYFFK